jgi:hypothetical protein
MLFFKSSAYSSALDKNQYSEPRLFLTMKRNVQYTYGHADLQQFSVEYKSSGWLGRKVIAIPAAILIGIFKTVYNVAKILFELCTSGKTSAKIQSYRLARDLQESYGWLTTLFNDKKGQFYIQKSQFNQSCYDFLTVTEQMLDARSQKLNNASSPEKIYDLASKYVYLGYGAKANTELDKINLMLIKKFQLKFVIAKAYYYSGHENEMNQILNDLTRNMVDNPTIKSDFMLFIAKLALYENNRNQPKAIEILKPLVNRLFDEAYLNNNLVFLIYMNRDLAEFVKDFFHLITVKCLSNLVEGGDEIANQNALVTAITTMISETSTLNAFLDLNLLSDSSHALEDVVLAVFTGTTVKKKNMDGARALNVLGLQNGATADRGF